MILTQKQRLAHYTLNTGHTRESARSEVSADVVKTLTPLLVPGRHSLPPPFDGYECEITIEDDGLMATVWKGQRPIVTFGVTPNETAAPVVWEALQDLFVRCPFKSGQSVVRRPEAVPWCAAIVIAMFPDENWVADFERCLAWAWIEKTN